MKMKLLLLGVFMANFSCALGWAYESTVSENTTPAPTGGPPNPKCPEGKLVIYEETAWGYSPFGCSHAEKIARDVLRYFGAPNNCYAAGPVEWLCAYVSEIIGCTAHLTLRQEVCCFPNAPIISSGGVTNGNVPWNP